MKIRFDSRKEQNPSQEQGLDVLYAPGKRMAFRVRWYLILFLVASPLIWLAGKLIFSLLLIDAPAQLRLPMQEVRARDAGRVEQLNVKTGDQVQPGQSLVRLDNPEWRARLAQLESVQAQIAPVSQIDSGAAERQLLKARLSQAEQRVQQWERLVQQGAATRAEVLTAATERDALRSDLLAFERREQMARQSPQGFDKEVMQQNAELQWLKTRLDALSVVAPDAGRISDVLVTEGENVGPGTVLMRLELPADPLLWIYLEPSNISYAEVGQPLRVRMPDGEWLDAHVVQTVESASRTPVDLRGPFAASQVGLQVAARFDLPLPVRWRIDQLPLSVRFPTNWRRMVGVEN